MTEIKVIHREVLCGKDFSCEYVNDYDGKQGFLFYIDIHCFKVFWPVDAIPALIQFLKETK